MKTLIQYTLSLLLLFTLSCGGSSGTSTTTYTISGTISGLVGSLVLQNNGANNLTVDSDGSFSFTIGLEDGATYEVTISSQTGDETCTINNGSGTVATANVTNITITCSDMAYTIGGTVTGLSGTVVLQNNSGDDLTLTSSGSFEFDTALADGASYSVTVSSNPSIQTCTASSNSGTIDGADITDVTITCSTNTYSVGGTISGLSGTITLQNNSDDDLDVTEDGSFTFDTEVADGGDYAVTVSSQPSGQTCTVTDGSGTIDSAAITDVSITCSSNTIILFATAATDGNLGGRSGIDSTCSTQATSLALDCGTVKGFTSVSATDEIRDMPSNYGVPEDSEIQSSTAETVADDWADLLDGSIDQSLEDAGVLESSDTFWWSGSDENGALVSTNCTEWSSDSSGQTADAGYYNQTSTAWMAAGTPNCNQNHKALCLCF